MGFGDLWKDLGVIRGSCGAFGGPTRGLGADLGVLCGIWGSMGVIWGSCVGFGADLGVLCGIWGSMG